MHGLTPIAPLGVFTYIQKAYKLSVFPRSARNYVIIVQYREVAHQHPAKRPAANSKSMKTKILSVLYLTVIGVTVVHGSSSEQPKMNGKLKVTTLAPEDARYTGKPYSKELGAYVFNCRNYDPEAGRWTTRDPSGFPDGANNRVYAPIPTIQVDSRGLDVSVTGIPENSTSGSVLSFAYVGGEEPHPLMVFGYEAQSTLQYTVTPGYSGYIIQHVTMNNTVNGSTNTVQPYVSYYEAWGGNV